MSKEASLDSKVPSPRPFPSGPGGIDLTYDQEGNTVSAGHRGASLAVIAEGPFSKILRGRSGLGEIALKIQKEKAPLPNPQADERWAREYRALESFGGEEPGLLMAEPLPGFESEGEAPPRFEPLFLCREQGTLFHLPCPRCMRVHVLADCRDEGALSAAGLPSYADSTERVVWCAACGLEEPVFYTRKERRGPSPVKDFVGLVRDLRSVVDQGRDEEPLPSELLSGLEQSFPCHTCEERAACFPRPGSDQQGLAEARLTPLSMNEFYAYPLPLCELRFDESADLLSGSKPAEMVRRYGKAWNTPALRRMKDEAIHRETPADALEALAAKLDLIAQAVQSVHRLHVLSGSPHLSISPAHVLVQPGEGGTPLVRLASPEAPPRLGEMRLPPLDLVAPYASPALSDGRFGKELPARIHVGKVWSGGGGTFFGAVLQAKDLPSGDLQEKDQIRVTVKLPGWEGIELWCQRLPGDREKLQAGSIAIVSAPVELSEEQVNDLKEAKGKEPLFGTASAFRDYGIAFDVHALGMLIFRALLVNEVQSFERVIEELVLPVTSSLTLCRTTNPRADLEDFSRMLREELSREPAARLADRKNVWHLPDKADPERIPEEAWTDLLTIAFRGVTWLPGFSFCASDRDAAGSDPGAPTLAMLADLEGVSQGVTGALAAGHASVPAVEELEDSVVSAMPLSDTEIRQITGEVLGGVEIAQLRGELEASEKARHVLTQAWEEIYEAVTGMKDRDGAPGELGDGRLTLLSTTIKESIECITQVFKGVAHFGGDELGENVPKIRVMIQDALRDSQQGEANVEDGVRQIKRQLKALRMFLFAVVQTFLEAHSYSTKTGTESLLRLLEKGLFEPVSKGRRAKEPDAEEIKRRFAEIAKSIPGKHQRVFQPFFQQYVRDKLKKVT